MATYGKKRRHILPVLSVNRASGTTADSKKGRLETKGSIASKMSTNHNLNTCGLAFPSRRDSIEEMANMLLEDTKVTHGQVDNNNEIIEKNFSDESLIPDRHAQKLSAHSKNGSTTQLPYRPAQRNSTMSANPSGGNDPGDRQVGGSTPDNLAESNNSSPTCRNVPKVKPSTFNAADVNSKIEAMIAATKALKPDATDSLLQARLPTKKRRLKDGNVLMKMKAAMGYHLHPQANEKHKNPRRIPNEETTIPLSALTTMEMRMNEGNNMKKPKIVNLTGHGRVPRKPLAEDGKSITGRKSISDDPLSEIPLLSGGTQTPPSLEHQLRRKGSDITLKLSSNAYSDRDELLRAKTPEEPLPPYDTDFEAPFSSSPLAQSTPRIRLERKATLTDSYSLCDLESSSVDIDHSNMGLGPLSIEKTNDGDFADRVQRKTPKSKVTGLQVRYHHSKKMKKHPSPSKADLETWEIALKQYPGFDEYETFTKVNDETEVNIDSCSAINILGPKCANAKLQESIRKQDQEKGSEISLKQDLSRISDVSNRSKVRKSFVTRPTSVARSRSRKGARRGRSYSSNDVNKASYMDIDELQWEQPALLRKA